MVFGVFDVDRLISHDVDLLTCFGGLSVLNSSKRRPLRGGYWVVYSGPYSTLAAVSRRAGNIHAAGYRAAYIREVTTYR